MSVVGRAAEKARIEGLLADIRRNRSAALLVRGQAGIGKSTLLHHATALAEADGLQVLKALGSESDSELAYAGLHQLLFPHLDRLDSLPGPQADALRGAFGLAEVGAGSRFLIGAGALSLLAQLAEDAPVLCVVDDMQWFDQASSEALMFAARRFEVDPVGMLFAMREASMPFTTSGLDVLQLEGLDDADALSLLAAGAPGLTEPLRSRVLAEAAGNPLAVIELGSLGRELGDSAVSELGGPVGALPVPHRVEEAYRRQIADLPDRTRTALLVAAADTAAASSTIVQVISALGGSAADLAPAERARLVRVGGRVEFRHPLVRSAAYQGEPLHRRLTVHRGFAEALSADADRRAWHLAAATAAPDEEVAVVLDGVAERARQRGGPMAVSLASEHAARLSEQEDAAARRIALAAEAAYDAGRSDRALRLAGEALRSATDARTRASAFFVQGAVAYERTSPQADAELALDAFDLVRDTDPELAAMCLYEATHAARHGAEQVSLSRCAEELRHVSAPSHWQPVLAALLGWTDLFAGRSGRAIGPMRALPSEGAAAAIDLPHRITAALSGLLIGDEDDALERASDLLAEARSTGALAWVPYTLNVLAVARLLRGEFAAARACVTEGAGVCDELGNVTEGLAFGSLEVWILAVSGAEERCRELSEEVLPRARGRHLANAEIGAWGVAVLDLSVQRYASAADRLERVCRGAARRDVVMRAVPDLVEAAVRSGEPTRAADASAQFERWAEHVDRPHVTALALRCRALLDDDGADEVYAESLRLHERHGSAYDRARTCLVYGEWLRRRRRRHEARVHLETAVSEFERVGASAWAARAAAELAAAGGEREKVAGSGPLMMLTSQELQVVLLAAAGSTNKEIAAQLYLSPRTVGHHLYKAFPKLGVESRAELAGLLPGA